MRLYVLLFSALLIGGMAPARSAETYDLIFKNGTLSDVSTDRELEYERKLSISADEGYSERNTGTVRLSFEPDETARLRFEQDEKARNIGAFPATVGNPVVMYFIETVLRDVAQQAGGSPFYIRNRIKESLVQFAEIEDVSVVYGSADIAAQQITLRPFLNDRNREKMRGYQDLEITFTMSEDVPGWYRSLVATAQSPAGQLFYQNALILRPEEEGQ